MTGSTSSSEVPSPLVSFRVDPSTWLRNKVLLLIDAIVLAHIGVFIVAAVYYVTTQTNPTIKHWWDTTVTPASLRHDIRDVGEGVLASCFAQAIVWNPFIRRHRDAGRRFRELRARWHVPVAVAAIVSAIVVGAVAFVLGETVLHVWSVHSHTATPAGSLWNRTTVLWRSNLDKKALGFVAALAARRPLHVVFDEAQAYFAGRRALIGAGVRWYHPPVFQARYNYLRAHQYEARSYPSTLSFAAGAALTVGIVLASYGYYILTFKA